MQSIGTIELTYLHPPNVLRYDKFVEEVLERLKYVCIEHDDAINVIKRWDSPQTFFYCDPPYIGTDQKDYSRYTIDDHNNLLKVLENISGSFLLSHYEQPEIKYPNNWEMFEKSTICNAKRRTGYNRSKKKDESNQNRKRTEILLRKLASCSLFHVSPISAGYSPGITR